MQKCEKSMILAMKWKLTKRSRPPPRWHTTIRLECWRRFQRILRQKKQNCREITKRTLSIGWSRHRSMARYSWRSIVCLTRSLRRVRIWLPPIQTRTDLLSKTSIGWPSARSRLMHSLKSSRSLCKTSKNSKQGLTNRRRLPHPNALTLTIWSKS